LAFSSLFCKFAGDMTYEALWKRLTPLYEAGEAKAIARWMLDVRFGLTMADILCNIVPVTVLLRHTYWYDYAVTRIQSIFNLVHE